MTDYQPLNCDWHDALVVAAMRHQSAQLSGQEPGGRNRIAVGELRDIDVGHGEEFLRFDVNGEPFRMRLDWIDRHSFLFR